jgi:hypothetical protein
VLVAGAAGDVVGAALGDAVASDACASLVAETTGGSSRVDGGGAAAVQATIEDAVRRAANRWSLRIAASIPGSRGRVVADTLAE